MSPTLSRRLLVIAVSLASLLACCALAWWQWQRYSSASGTWQNLGYVLQWPLFGLFPAFVFWRLRQLRLRETQAEGEAALADAERPVAVSTPRPEQRRVVADDEDAELAAYNAYLAELARTSSSKQEGRSPR